MGKQLEDPGTTTQGEERRTQFPGRRLRKRSIHPQCFRSLLSPPFLIGHTIEKPGNSTPSGEATEEGLRREPQGVAPRAASTTPRPNTGTASRCCALRPARRPGVPCTQPHAHSNCWLLLFLAGAPSKQGGLRTNVTGRLGQGPEAVPTLRRPRRREGTGERARPQHPKQAPCGNTGP